VATLTALAFFTVVGGVSVPNPGAVLFLAVIWLIRWTIWLVIGLVIVQAILSWVNPYAPLAPAIQQLTQPFLAPIRRVVPLVGGVDLSPLVLIVLLQVLLMVVDPATLPGLLR
jgi:YggT family protein